MNTEQPKPVELSVATVEPSALTPFDLLNRAVKSGAQIEVMEKLMELQQRWERNEARKAFDTAIAKAKAEIPVITKGNKVDFTSARGRTCYAYEDLATIARVIDPILSRHGLSYRFRPNADEQFVGITCILSHSAGHCEESTLKAPHDQSGNKNTIQAVGSTVTYLQRYTLKAALGLAAAEDDDGRGGVQSPQKPPQRPPAAQTPPAQKSAPTSPTTRPAAKSADVLPKDATEEQKQRWLAMLEPVQGAALQYYIHNGILLDTEDLKDLPLSKVPTGKHQADKTLAAIEAFVRRENTPDAPPNVSGNQEPAEDESWREFVLPFGKDKGTTLGDLDKKTLYGWVMNFEVKDLDENGNPRKPEWIESDQELRDALDAAGEHYQFKA